MFARRVILQTAHVKLELPVEILGTRLRGKRFTIIVLEDDLRFRLVGIVGMRKQELVDEGALTTAMRPGNRDSHTQNLF